MTTIPLASRVPLIHRYKLSKQIQILHLRHNAEPTGSQELLGMKDELGRKAEEDKKNNKEVSKPPDHIHGFSDQFAER